jgi:arginine/lysine/histidine transporter system substrate-binding protein
MKKFAITISSILLLLGVATGCGNKSTGDTAAPSASAAPGVSAAPENPYTKAGKIVLGTSADYAPYEFHKSINGKDTIVGFDIEIAKAIAKDLGVELEIKDMKFDGLLAALQAGNIDFVLSGMTPNEERAKSVDFSKIYYTAEQAVVVRAEDKDKFKTMDDLKTLKIGVQKSTIQEKLAQDQLPNAQLKALGKIPDLVLELKNKKVDALIAEAPVAKGYVKNNNDLAVSAVTPKTDDNGSAVAIKKGNTFLLEQVNKSLDKLIAEKKIDQFVTEANELNEQ